MTLFIDSKFFHVKNHIQISPNDLLKIEAVSHILGVTDLHIFRLFIMYMLFLFKEKIQQRIINLKK